MVVFASVWWFACRLERSLEKLQIFINCLENKKNLLHLDIISFLLYLRLILQAMSFATFRGYSSEIPFHFLFHDRLYFTIVSRVS